MLLLPFPFPAFAVVLTAVDDPGAPAVAAGPACGCSHAIGVSNVSGVHARVGVPSAVVNILSSSRRFHRLWCPCCAVGVSWCSSCLLCCYRPFCCCSSFCCPLPLVFLLWLNSLLWHSCCYWSPAVVGFPAVAGVPAVAKFSAVPWGSCCCFCFILAVVSKSDCRIIELSIIGTRKKLSMKGS